MTRIKLVAALGASLMSLVALAAPASAQVSNDDEFSSQGGPAGCFDPNRVTARQRDSLIRMGSEPCPARRTDTPPETVAGIWYGNSEGAAVDDSADLGLTLGVLCDRGGMFLSVIAARPSADRLLAGVRTVSVTIAGRAGSITLTLSRDADGDHAIKLDPAQLAKLKASNLITVTAPRWTARFSGRDAARRLAGVRC